MKLSIQLSGQLAKSLPIVPLLLGTVIYFANPTPCYGDTVSAAIGAVETFSARAAKLTSELPPDTETDSFKNSLLERKEKTISGLKQIRWTDEPGRRRFKRITSRLDKFFKETINSLKQLGMISEPTIKTITAELKTLGDEHINEVSKAYQAQRLSELPPEPVPAVDVSPYDESAPEGRGIWER